MTGSAQLLIVSIAVALIGCSNADRLAEFRLSPGIVPAPQAASQADRERVRKRLSEVADALGFDEKQASAAPQTIADFAQPVRQGAVEIRAYAEGGLIVVEVSQRKPTSSSCALFEKAKALVRARLHGDFTSRVSETSSGRSMWSFIRSEDAVRAYPSTPQ